MKTFLSIIVFSLFLFFGCKKYPEGGYKFQAKSLIQGEKELVMYTVDRIDSLQYFFDNEFCGCPSRKFEFAIQSSSGAKRFLYRADTCVGGTPTDAYWYLVDKKNSLKINFAWGCYGKSDFPFHKGNSYTWEILKLDKKELYIINSNSGKNYEILFKSL